MDTQANEDSAKEEGELSDDCDNSPENITVEGDDKSYYSSVRDQTTGLSHKQNSLTQHRDGNSYQGESFDSMSRKYDRSPEWRRYQEPRKENDRHDDRGDSGRSGFWSRRRSQARYGQTPRRERRPLAAVPVPSLLSMPLQPAASYLNPQPPPPPPPPPPPLPSSPPPTVPEPPPLVTPRYNPGNKNQQRSFNRIEESITPKADDSEYIDLLLEYTQIKKQLESIKKEEAKAEKKDDTTVEKNQAIAEEKSSPPVSTENQEKTETEGSILIDLTEESDHNKSLDENQTDAVLSDLKENTYAEANSPTSKLVAAKIPIPETKPETREEEEENADEDMDILELKLAALASTVKAENRKTPKLDKTASSRTIPTNNKPRTRRDSTRKRNSQQTSAATRRRQMEEQKQAEIKRRQAARKKREAERLRKEERRREEAARWKEEERLRREAREERERKRREFEQKERDDRLERERFNEKRLAAQKLLTLDDPEEQYKRFMELFSDGRDHEMINKRMQKNKSRTSSVDSRTKESPLLRDNYEEVEMDLDSDDGSGAAIEVVPQVLIPGLDIVNRLKTIANMPAPVPVPTPEYLVPLSVPYGNNWGASVPVKHEEPTIPGLDLIYERNDPMDLEEDETENPPGAISCIEYVAEPQPPQEPTLTEPREPDIPASAPSITREVNEKEEDEEGKLRAKLLRSLMKRRQEKAENEARSSAGSSPNTDREYTATRITKREPARTNQVTNKKPTNQNMWTRELPRHAPVVVQLGPDSDDSEEETHPQEDVNTGFFLPGSLDQFLKEARQSVEAQQAKIVRQPLITQPTPSYVVQQRPPVPVSNSPHKRPTAISKKEKKAQLEQILNEKVAQLETALAKEREEVDKEIENLDLINKQISRKKNNLRQSEVKVQKLREQLAAAERVVKANQTQLQKYDYKVQRSQGLVVEKKRRISAIEKQLIVAGQKAYGDRRIQPNDTGDMRITIANAKNADFDPRFIAEEKARLQAEEKRLLDMIRSVKEGQADGQGLYSQVPSVTMETEYSYEVPEIEHIQTEERMSFSFGPEVEKEVTNIEPKRRKSLGDVRTGTKPNLPVKKIEKNDKATDSARNKQGKVSDSEDKSGDKELPLPSGQRQQALSKRFADNMKKLMGDSAPISAKISLPFPHKLLTVLPYVKSNSVSKSQQKSRPGNLKPYKSILKSFRSYRFSPYYRTKEGYNLKSPTFSNKIDPNRVLCRFDLTGKCNDPDCPWQHKQDYELSESELLSDLVSYEIKLTGVENDNCTDAETKPLVGKYVAKFQKQNDKMPFDDRCVLLTSIVNSSAKHVPPHTVFHKKRKWKLDPVEKRALVKKEERKENGRRQVETPNTHINRLDDDNIIFEGDVRYWMLATEEVEDMESAVLENPTNIDIWLKLAYKKLTERRSKSGHSGLDHALNVLARALELNRNSRELWQHYLTLYSKRDNPEDLVVLCKQAVQFAPSYDLFWIYLEIVRKCSLKNKLCKRILLFLCSNICKNVPRDERSHQLLEMLLYQVSLNLNIGKFKSAIVILQTTLKSKEAVYKNMLSLMTKPDRVILWLSCIHLLEFRKLPGCLYDSCNGNPGRIVSKEPFSIPWKGKSTKEPPAKLKSCIEEAISSLVGEALDSQFLFPLYKVLADLEIFCHQPEGAIQAYRRLLDIDPQNIDCWIAIAEIHISIGFVGDAIKVLKEEALQNCPFSSKLYFHATMFLMSQGDTDGALDLGEDSAINLYNVDVRSKSCDPHLLYCKLLHQSLPLDYNPPELKKEFTTSIFEAQRPYVWLCYCLLLELQGYEDSKITDGYETALSSLYVTADLKLIWFRYLQYKYEIAVASKTQESLKVLSDLVHRCLMTMPSKFSLPFNTNKYWLDFSFHNKVIEFYISCLPQTLVLPTLEKYAGRMPQNISLIQRTCHYLGNTGDFILAKGHCVAALYESPRSWLLWRMRLYFSYMEGKPRELRKLFRKATKNLPYTLSLWKDFLLFEVANGSSEGVKSVLDQCLELELNMQEFKDAVLK